jgi:4-hydroxybenzoate polyprenyltransferase
VIWAGVYDTLYAMVDRDDDLKLGVHSTAVAFGDMDQVLVGAMQGMVLIGLLFAGHTKGMHWHFYVSLLVGAVFFAWQLWLIRNRERDACFKAFLNNNYFGLVVFAGIALGMPRQA